MGLYYIGEVIKRTRESLGMTQEELSEGICTTETLSRIETGKRTPNRANFKALMERMGRCGEKYFPHIRVESYKKMEQWEKILQLNQSHQFEEALMKLEDFEEHLDLEDKVNRQAAMRMRALCSYNLGEISAKEKRVKLNEALQLTIPHWDGKNVPKGVFTRTECGIVCNIAVSYMQEENYQEALDIMRQMQKYFETTRMNEEEKCVSEGLLLSNLAQCLGRSGETEEALEIEEKETKRYMKYDMAGRIYGSLYNIAYGMEVQHMEEEACKEKLIQAYYLADFVGDIRIKSHIRKHFEERYGKLKI